MSIETIKKAENSLYGEIINEMDKQSGKKYNENKFSFTDLDRWRREQLPSIVAKRYKENKATWLTQSELELLLDWKLAKGVFRMNLPKLVRSNDKTEEFTKEGFKVFLDFIEDKKTQQYWSSEANIEDYIKTIKSAFKSICKLRGVGPAMASLILSLVSDINIQLAPPFFSDESFMYFVIDSKRPDTKIKYNVKEYTEELLPIYFKILQNDGYLDMNSLERGAWALKKFDIHKIDKLADIKPSFTIPEGQAFHFKCGAVDEEPKRKKIKT